MRGEPAQDVSRLLDQRGFIATMEMGDSMKGVALLEQWLRGGL